MKRLTLSVTLLLTGALAIAQTNPNKLQIYLRWHPLAFINPNRPTVQGSVEFRKSNWGLELTYGQRYLDYSLLSQKGEIVSKYDFGGYTTRAEIKRYNILMDQPSEEEQNSFSNYIALSGWYINDRHNDYAEIVKSSEKVEDYFSVNRRVIVGALQYGCSFTGKNRIGFDFYVSLGVRYRTVSLEHYEESLSKDNRLRAILAGYEPAELVSLHSNACFKVHYKVY